MIFFLLYEMTFDTACSRLVYCNDSPGSPMRFETQFLQIIQWQYILYILLRICCESRGNLAPVLFTYNLTQPGCQEVAGEDCIPGPIYSTPFYTSLMSLCHKIDWPLLLLVWPLLLYIPIKQKLFFVCHQMRGQIVFPITI